MNPRLIALLVISAALAITALWQQQIIRHQSAQLSELQASVAAHDQLAAEQLKTAHERDEALKSEADQLRAKLSAIPIPATASVSATPSPREDKVSPLVKMMKDPSMRKMIAAQQRMAMPMLYGDLVKKLGLSSDEANQFYDLLAAQQVKTLNAGMDLMDGKKAAVAPPDESALKDLLGDRFGQYDQYKKTLGERFALNQFKQTLTGANALQDTQQEGLLQIMAEERSRAPSNVLYSSNNAPMSEKVAALNSPEAMDEFEAQQKQINAAVQARAKSILSAQQFSAFQAYLEQQTATQKMQLEMGKKMLSPTTP